MTTFRERATDAADNVEGRLSLAEVLEIFAAGRLPLKFTAYDGSSAGPHDATLGLDLRTPRGTTYLATAPGDLGLARAYVSGDLEPHGVHPGDPYDLLTALTEKLDFKRPPARVLANIIRSIGIEHLIPIAPPPQEALPRWRRFADGLRHSKTRDAGAIQHHYDVSNTFYEWVLGPSMTYTCAVYPHPDATLEEAQENKYRLVFEKLRLRPGDRLLDVGCGWGALVVRAAQRGARAVGITLSENQYAHAKDLVAHLGLESHCEIRLQDYRDVPELGSYDKVVSVGMFEHVGVKNLPLYFGQMKTLLADGGAMLMHGITATDPDRRRVGRGAGEFIHRYVFPDGELPHISAVLRAMAIAGLEVADVESLRRHYALTLSHWANRLDARPDAARAAAGEKRFRIWRVYMAGCAYGFRENWMNIHQVLACKLGPPGQNPFPMTRDWMYR
jgi:cyclopropane-fatty-acyl-phospholipid synthase